MKILLVDDEEANLYLFKMLLENYGYTVLCAASGVEALQLIENHTNIEAMVTDFMMPGMDGGELSLMVRKQCPEIRIVILSGDELFLSDLPQADRVLRKPVDSAYLVEAIGVC